ncbi:MAG: UDP-N-acetylmuramoyl-tripeptide--D-alanyl-D-alanine ligase [Proteobacteria bacterium]|nr:UDP-N-acetylmuramoyl-tripeptide--D-alanyl-D-alanine ligase [Pseudomonadota bacterium]
MKLETVTVNRFMGSEAQRFRSFSSANRQSSIVHPVRGDSMPVGWGKITAKEILGPVKGSLISGDPETVLAGINTDSRIIRDGDLFWALRGERYDGHDFALKAIEKGSAGIVAQRSWVQSGWPVKDLDSVVISVDDTLKALGDLAAWWRRQHNLKVVAITGSSGKTTTKEMVAAILELGHRTLKNQGNFNNLVGLPLTLLKLEEGYERAVLEMGMNRPGEIYRLTEIAHPDVGVILNVGMAHLEGLSDLDGVAKAKTELMEKIPSRGLIILNGDDGTLMKRASVFSKQKMTFGLGEGNDVRAVNIRDNGPEGITFDLQYRDNSWPVRVRVPGLHNLGNALAAAAVGLSLSEPPENIVKGLDMFSGIKGRFRMVSLSKGITLVDDTYNANPSSLGAALASVSSLVNEGGKIIVGLGEMLELGDATIHAHREAGRKVAEIGAYFFFAMGEHAGDMIEGARIAGMPENRLKIVETHDQMVKGIIDTLTAGSLVFLKGSRKMELEKVTEGLSNDEGRMTKDYRMTNDGEAK